jgi:hypothetical protein
MSKPLWYRWGRVYFAGFCIIGSGVVLFKYTTPTDEELIAAFSPDVRADYERNKEFRKREQEELRRIGQITAALNDPIWKTGPIGSPFEKDQRDMGQQLIDYNDFQKKTGDEFKKLEISKANQELLETEKLVKQKKSSWW